MLETNRNCLAVPVSHFRGTWHQHSAQWRPFWRTSIVDHWPTIEVRQFTVKPMNVKEFDDFFRRSFGHFPIFCLNSIQNCVFHFPSKMLNSVIPSVFRPKRFCLVPNNMLYKSTFYLFTYILRDNHIRPHLTMHLTMLLECERD